MIEEERAGKEKEKTDIVEQQARMEQLSYSCEHIKHLKDFNYQLAAKEKEEKQVNKQLNRGNELTKAVTCVTSGSNT